MEDRVCDKTCHQQHPRKCPLLTKIMTWRCQRPTKLLQKTLSQFSPSSTGWRRRCCTDIHQAMKNGGFIRDVSCPSVTDTGFGAAWHVLDWVEKETRTDDPFPDSNVSDQCVFLEPSATIQHIEGVTSQLNNLHLSLTEGMLFQ